MFFSFWVTIRQQWVILVWAETVLPCRVFQYQKYSSSCPFPNKLYRSGGNTMTTQNDKHARTFTHESKHTHPWTVMCKYTHHGITKHTHMHRNIGFFYMKCLSGKAFRCSLSTANLMMYTAVQKSGVGEIFLWFWKNSLSTDKNEWTRAWTRITI